MDTQSSTVHQWESMYENLFSKWQRAETLCRKKDEQLSHYQDYHRENISTKDDVVLYGQRCEELQEAVKELTELRKIDRKEKDLLVEEKNLESEKLGVTYDLLQEQKLKLIEQQQVDNDTVNSLQQTVSSMRNKLNELLKVSENKDSELQTLREQNEQLHQVLSDKSDSKLSKAVKILDAHDLLLSRYLDAFPQDTRELCVQLVDKVTSRCSHAFKLLVRKCYEDLVCNLKGVVLLIPDTDTFVRTIFDLDLDLEAIMYLRVIQCLYPGLFDTLEATLIKQHDLTRHKINYRQAELNQARQIFALAFLSKHQAKHFSLSSPPPPPPPPSLLSQQTLITEDSCPVGFDNMK